jgi:signal transduction histidine kinase
MLARLEAAGARQREFVGDASHELRTPLTTLRAQLEVALAHPGTTSWELLAVDLLDDVAGMELLVRDLLHLAREDADAAPADRTLVDLDEVVMTEVERQRARLTATGVPIAVDATGVSAGPVRGSADELGRAVRNLLDNAVEHASSVVRVRLSSDDRVVTLTVADDGPGIPEEQREWVFERFTRLQPDRARGGIVTVGRSGTGLGLAIVRGVARRHGGDAVAESSALGGVALVVRLPLAG